MYLNELCDQMDWIIKKGDNLIKASLLKKEDENPRTLSLYWWIHLSGKITSRLFELQTT